MDFLENIRYKQKYTTSINESKYTQSTSNVINNIHDTSNSYKTLEELIIYTYDHNSLLNDNTKLYIEQFKLKLATDIDEKSSDKYDNYKYSKKMKKNLIQNGLQQIDTISTIIYLGDIFSIDIIIKSNDNYYQLVNKKRGIFFVEYKGGLWRSIEKCEYKLNTSEDLQNILDYNIKIDDIYVKYLKAISNYKIQELIDIAQKHNIDVKINGKKRTKLDLYNEINMKVIV